MKIIARVTHHTVDFYEIEAESVEHCEDADWDSLNPELVSSSDKTWAVSFWNEDEG